MFRVKKGIISIRTFFPPAGDVILFQIRIGMVAEFFWRCWQQIVMELITKNFWTVDNPNDGGRKIKSGGSMLGKRINKKTLFGKLNRAEHLAMREG